MRGGADRLRRHTRTRSCAPALAHRARARGLRRAALAGCRIARARRAVAEPRADSGASTAARGNAIEIHKAREHNLKNIDVRHAAQSIHRHHRRLRQRQEHAGLRHPVRRRPAPLSRVAQRLCAAVRAARLAPRRRCDLRHTAHGRDRAAHQPRRAQEHGGDAHRDLSLPATAVREARRAVLPRLRRRRSSRRSADAIAARLLKDYRGTADHAARAADRRAQGLYTTLAKWAREARAFASCASTARCCRRRRGRG